MSWLSNILGGFTNEAADDILYKMIKDKYTDNLLAGVSIAKRLSGLTAMELLMRATQGEALERPLGTHLHLSPWDKLLFNPVHLHRFPVADPAAMDGVTVIGPHAAKPLQLQIPIFIAGMSYGGALSKAAKIALAKGASQMGTATNTGEAGLLPEEREAASKLIGQYNRGGYLNTTDKYKQLDAIEIQLAQGAQGAAPQRTEAKFIDSEMREVFGLKEGQDSVLHSRIPGINSTGDFKDTVNRLKKDTGVPIGVKMAASHYLERDLEVAVAAGVDFITLDGAEGATHGASPTTEDDLGLPSIYAIARARRFLDKTNLTGKVTLLAGGGLFTPGQFMKALALGADAVYIGTAAIMGILAEQALKALPSEPPPQLLLQTGRLKDQFDPELGAKTLVNFLKLSIAEMSDVMYSLGKTAFNQLGRDDLCCLDPWLARALNIPYAGVAPEEQTDFYQDMNIAAWQPPVGQHQPQLH